MEPMPPVPPMPPPPAPPPAPPPVPPPVPPPAPPPPGPPDTFEQGGLVNTWNWVEIGFMTLGAAALYLIIDYYRQKAKAEKENQATLTNVASDVEKVKMEFNGMKRFISSASQRR